MTFQCARIFGQSRRICGTASGSMKSTANDQRQNANATGGTLPTAARPITQLPDQNSTVRVSSR